MMWCTAFAGLHLFWAFGGSLGLASSVGRDLATRRPAAFVIFGLYGVTLMLLVGVAVIGVACTAEPGKRRSVAVALVALVGVVLILRAVVLELLLTTDVAGVLAQVGPLEARWSQILWNPWFALGGASFIVAARQLRRSPRRRLVR